MEDNNSQNNCEVINNSIQSNNSTFKIFQPRLLKIPNRPQKKEGQTKGNIIDYTLEKSRQELHETRKKYNTTKQTFLEKKEQQENYLPDNEMNILSYYDNPFKYMDYLIEKYCNRNF